MNIVLETSRSSLLVHDLPEDIIQLLEKSVELLEKGENIVPLDYHPEIIIFGKECNQQRSVGFYSNESTGYNYSKTLTPAKPLFYELQQLLQYVNDKFQIHCNGVLINKYENGNEYIGKHSDDENTLVKECGVISMSFGAVRNFRIRDKFTNKIVLDLPTLANQIIQMKGDFQKEFTHEIPVSKKIKDARYSFTFRCHL
jgi:alkylated DNA repair dioxygenase AlkB